jgi:hypothetical protein
MLTLLLALAAAPSPRDSTPARYHLVNKSTVVVGDGMQTVEITLSEFVSVTMHDSGAGQLAHVVVDSSSFDAGTLTAMLPEVMTRTATGSSLDVYLVNGATRHWTPSANIAQTMQLAPAVQLLLVGTRATRGGDHWVDTTASDTTVAVAKASGAQIIAWSAKEAAAGVIELDGTSHGTTSVATGGTQLAMETTGTSHLSGRAGALPQSATATDTGEATMNAAGSTMKMKVVHTMTIDALP